MILTFTGDLSITGSFVKKIEGNEEIFSSHILDELGKSNFVVSNLEGPVTNIEPQYSEAIKFKSPTSTVKYLSSRNLKVFNLANNHILDCKSKGLIDTIENIKQHNCRYFGAGESLTDATKTCILEDKGLKIALIGFTVSSMNFIKENSKIGTTKHLSIFKKNISDLKNKVDYIILNYHGGEEFTNYPSPTKRNFLKSLTKIQGIDIIICHHSHTLQAYEKYNNKLIFYSLGNFIFDIPAHSPYKYTNSSALLKFNFSKNKFHFSLIPFYNENGMIKDANKVSFDNYFKTICDFKNYRQKWRAEAYRVLFRYNLIPQKEIIPLDNSKPLQEKTLIELFLSKKFYSKTIKILLNDNYRSLYISAIFHKLKLKK